MVGGYEPRRVGDRLVVVVVDVAVAAFPSQAIILRIEQVLDYQLQVDRLETGVADDEVRFQVRGRVLTFMLLNPAIGFLGATLADVVQPEIDVQVVLG